jgi:protein-L-isoaspartate(D-aspartate) O-methyltransferase
MMDSTNHNGIGMTSERTRRRLVSRLRERGIGDERVLEVIGRTPRHLFVDEALASRAYDDTALPIGYGQTISQPFVVACMTEALIRDGSPERVLEVGTGSGYQAAVLAQLVSSVYTVERIRALADQARQRMNRLGYRNVHVRYRDGGEGWPEKAPFDAILLTAAPSHIPEALLEQLATGGRLVAPVGQPGAAQKLEVLEKTSEGLVRETLTAVSFVPMLGGTS